MQFTMMFKMALLSIGVAFILKVVYGDLSAYPGSQNSPNPLINSKGTFDFSELALSLINDFVLMAQVFVTCVPATTLTPITPLFVKVSCTFNMLSVLSLLLLSILDGWDRLDENQQFKIRMRSFFENWAESHTENINQIERRDLIPTLDGIGESETVGLHLDLYVKLNPAREKRLICGSFELRNSHMFKNKVLLQELCVSRKGIETLGKSGLCKMPVTITRELVQFLMRGGILKSLVNPPLYVVRVVQWYGDFASDITQKLFDMATIINSKSWDGHEREIRLEKDGDLLLMINIKSVRTMNSFQDTYS